MKKLLVSLLLAPLTAHAAMVGVVKNDEGQIELYSTPGLCVNGALAATYRSVKTSVDPIQGCWTMRGGVVYLVFLDGDMGQIPAAAVRKPEAA